jgi:hypothetical protein
MIIINLASDLFLLSDLPEIEVERSWVHSGEGYEAQLVCIVHAEPHADVSTHFQHRLILVHFQGFFSFFIFFFSSFFFFFACLSVLDVVDVGDYHGYSNFVGCYPEQFCRALVEPSYFQIALHGIIHIYLRRYLMYLSCIYLYIIFCTFTFQCCCIGSR